MKCSSLITWVLLATWIAHLGFISWLFSQKKFPYVSQAFPNFPRGQPKFELIAFLCGWAWFPQTFVGNIYVGLPEAALLSNGLNKAYDFQQPWRDCWLTWLYCPGRSGQARVVTTMPVSSSFLWRLVSMRRIGARGQWAAGGVTVG